MTTAPRRIREDRCWCVHAISRGCPEEIGSPGWSGGGVEMLCDAHERERLSLLADLAAEREGAVRT